MPTLEELIADYEGKKAEKDERRAARRAAQYAEKSAEKGKTDMDMKHLEVKASEEAVASSVGKASIERGSSAQ